LIVEKDHLVIRCEIRLNFLFAARERNRKTQKNGRVGLHARVFRRRRYWPVRDVALSAQYRRRAPARGRARRGGEADLEAVTQADCECRLVLIRRRRQRVDRRDVLSEVAEITRSMLIEGALQVDVSALAQRIVGLQRERMPLRRTRAV